MKTLTIRIDADFEQKLRQVAEQKKIKFTRYIRSLLEKGLVIDVQLGSLTLGGAAEKGRDNFDIRLAQINIESLALLRLLVEAHPELKGNAKEILWDAEQRAKNYTMKIIGGVVTP